MISIASLSRFKKGITVLFGFSIAIAISCNIACALIDPPQGTYKIALSNCVDSVNHAYSNSTEKTSKHSCHNTADSGRQKDCCQHTSKDFYAIPSPQGETVGIQQPPSLPAFLCFNGNIASGLITIKLSKKYFSALKTPSKTSGYFLRILMSSFIL